MANEALVRIETHEKGCEARWSETNSAIKGLYRRLWWMVGLLIGAQTLLIGYLAERIAP